MGAPSKQKIPIHQFRGYSFHDQRFEELYEMRSEKKRKERIAGRSITGKLWCLRCKQVTEHTISVTNNAIARKCAACKRVTSWGP